MNRVKFSNNKVQVKFLKRAITKINKPIAQIAGICAVEKRTFYDWRRGKYQMSYGVLKTLAEKARIPIPKKISLLPLYWYVRKGAHKGAINRNRIYGNPGTSAGRRKGGLATVEKFRLNPGYAEKKGFKVRKEISYPVKSNLFVEFIGIVLGDGSINMNQVKITLNSKTDKKYAVYVRKIIKRLFSLNPHLRETEKNTLEIVIYSRNLVDFLIKYGLKAGDKVFNQIDAPKWIFYNKGLIKACLRGLIDTDGGVYFHNHKTKGIRCRNIGLCFTNHSSPLLNSVYRMLLDLGISAKTDKKRHVSFYGVTEITKYLSKVGSSNPKHIARFKLYRESKV
ncbi:MAG: hypothetical protein KKA34_02680 [Candidatus Omnitrophica bacterium]|nr:hypothetical protein [Candidatus Omnitrophota bacterium]